MAKRHERRSTSLIPQVMLLQPDELNERLEWFDSEIHMLSTGKGVPDRIQYLCYSRAQLLATQAIIKVMNKGRGISGDEHKLISN